MTGLSRAADAALNNKSKGGTMRRKMTLLMAALPFLSGCAGYEAKKNNAAVLADLKNQTAFCQATAGAPYSVERANCVAIAERAAGPRLIPDQTGNFSLLAARIILDAEKVRDKQMTGAEAQYDMSQFAHQLDAELNAQIMQQKQLNIQQQQQNSHDYQNMMNNYFNATRPYNATPYIPSY